jgi:hypothetical protein
LGVQQAARDTEQAAVSIEGLGAAALAQQASIAGLDASVLKLGTDLKRLDAPVKVPSIVIPPVTLPPIVVPPVIVAPTVDAAGFEAARTRILGELGLDVSVPVTPAVDVAGLEATKARILGELGLDVSVPVTPAVDVAGLEATKARILGELGLGPVVIPVAPITIPPIPAIHVPPVVIPPIKVPPIVVPPLAVQQAGALKLSVSPVVDQAALDAARAKIKFLGAAVPPIFIPTKLDPTAEAQLKRLGAQAAEVKLLADATSAAVAKIGSGPVGTQNVTALRNQIAALEAAAEPTRLRGQLKALQAELGGVERAAAGISGGQLKGLFGALEGGAGSLIGKLASLGFVAGGVGLAVGALVLPFKHMVDEASASEDAIRRFDVALGSLGQFSTKASADFQAFASALQATTTQSDEAILASGALLAQVGRLGGAELKRAVQGAVELSAVLGVDLQTSTLQLTKAAEGNVESLQRLGISIDDSIPKGERLAAVLAKVEANLGGSAAAQADTLTGAVARLKNQWSDMAETLGKPLIVPLAGLFQAINAFLLFKNIAGGATSDARQQVDKLAADMIRLGESGRPLARLGADLKTIERLRLPTIELAFKKGNAEEILSVLEAIRSKRLEVQAEQVFPAIDTGPLDRLLAQGEKALRVRVEFEKGTIDEQIKSLETALRPRVLPIAFESDLKTLDGILRGIESRRAIIPVSANVEELRRQVDAEIARGGLAIHLPVLADLKADIPHDLAKTRELAFTLRATVTTQGPLIPTDQLDKEATQAADIFKQLANDTSQAGAVARDVVAGILTELTKLRGKRSILEFEAPALGPLQDAIDKVVLLRAELDHKPPPLLLHADATDVTRAVALLASGFGTLVSGGKASAEQLRGQFDTISGAIDAAEKAVPQLTGQMEALRASLAKQAGITMPVRLDLEAAKRDGQALAQLAVTLFQDIGKNPVELLTFKDQAAAVKDAAAGAALLQQAMEAAVASGDVEKQAAAIGHIGDAWRAAHADASTAGSAQRAILDETKQRADAVASSLGAVFKGIEVSKALDLHIRLLDFEAVRADIEAIHEQVLGFQQLGVKVPVELQLIDQGIPDKVRDLFSKATAPIHAELEAGAVTKAEADYARLIDTLRALGILELVPMVDLRKFDKDLKEARARVATAGEQAAAAFNKSMQGITLDAVSGGFAAALGGILGQATSFGDAMKKVFQTFVDDAIKQLARLAAAQALFAIGGLFSPGSFLKKFFQDASGLHSTAVLPPENKPTATPLPVPQLKPIVAPVPLNVPILPSVTGPIAVNLAFSTPDTVTLPAPRAKVLPFTPLSVQPSLRLAASIAALVVTPHLALKDAAAVPVVPKFHVEQVRQALVAKSPAIELSGVPESIDMDVPPFVLRGEPDAMRLAVPDFVLDRKPQVPRLVAPQLAAPAKAGPESASTRATLRVPPVQPSMFETAPLQASLQQASRAFAATRTGPAPGSGRLPALPILPGPGPLPLQRREEVPATAAFLREQIGRARETIRNPTFASNLQIEPGSDLINRFSPRGQLSGAQPITVITPDSQSIAQSIRRGELGRQLRKQRGRF